MASVTQSLNIHPKSNSIRTIDARQDLNAIADLIDICFADSLDQDGRNYIRQIRLAAKNPAITLMGLDKLISGLNGYVWEEDKKIVGNISILPVLASGQRSFLIANVAVRPDYRRRGIAKKLTQAALTKIKLKGVKTAWLHVSAHSPAAFRLYSGMGFIERAHRTTWHSSPSVVGQESKSEVSITRRYQSDWGFQESWFKTIYPQSLRWRMNLNEKIFRPGWGGEFSRLVSDLETEQWAARKHGNLVGTASWQASKLQADRIWLATTPEFEKEAIPSLLLYARRTLSPQRVLSINYPAYRAEEEFTSAGFYPQKTLIWMHIAL
jgi:GNAT superfamily N-acetyltransferase